VKDADQADALFNELYSELHRLARRELHRQGSIGGLGVTTLLHEAYLSIAEKQGWPSSTAHGSWGMPRA
jgi:hypothetical protein